MLRPAREVRGHTLLACALAAQADLIVLGDPDLLNLKAYQRIPILTAAEALKRISQR